MAQLQGYGLPLVAVHSSTGTPAERQRRRGAWGYRSGSPVSSSSDGARRRLRVGARSGSQRRARRHLHQVLRRLRMVILFNVTIWGCYVNSLKALSSLQAIVTNFIANLISSGLAGYFLFKEPLSSKEARESLAFIQKERPRPEFSFT